MNTWPNDGLKSRSQLVQNGYYILTIDLSSCPPIIGPLVLGFDRESRVLKIQICEKGSGRYLLCNCHVMGAVLYRAVQRDAAAARTIWAGDGQNLRANSIFSFSVRNSLDAGPGGHAASGKSRTGLPADEARQDRTDPTFLAHRPAAASGTRLWELHLTSLPAGGSCPQQALPAIRKPGFIPRRLHHGSASK